MVDQLRELTGDTGSVSVSKMANSIQDMDYAKRLTELEEISFAAKAASNHFR